MKQVIATIPISVPDDMPLDTVAARLNWVLNVGTQEAISVAEDGGEDDDARSEAAEINAMEVGEPTVQFK